MRTKTIKSLVRKATYHFVVAHAVHVRVTRLEMIRLTKDVPEYYWRFLGSAHDGGSFFVDFQNPYHPAYKLHINPEQFELLPSRLCQASAS